MASPALLRNRLYAALHGGGGGTIRLTGVRCVQSRRPGVVPPRRLAFSISAEAVSRPVQVYVSRSTDPYLNLSIEHYLLQKSHPESFVLFLYTNRPCIVIGRNQNPWVEVNLDLVSQRGILGLLRDGLGKGNNRHKKYDSHGGEDNDDVLLVRRRSGGGTVFHDLGNVNYSVICPPAVFDRDKHAEMVARALRSLIAQELQLKTPPIPIPTPIIPYDVRVNERHDIVIDIYHRLGGNIGGNNENKSETGSGDKRGGGVATYKVSGSAYKLTRTRSLHHGTCLLSSPNLAFLSRLLRSPAAPYIKARGVESVRSPVRNVDLPNAVFEKAVIGEFLTMYGDGDGDEMTKAVERFDPTTDLLPDEIRAGVEELRSREWIYGQTPQFVFSSHPTTDDPRPRPNLPLYLPPEFFPPPPPATTTTTTTETEEQRGLQMTVRHGQITEVVITAASDADPDPEESDAGSATTTSTSSAEETKNRLKSSLEGLYLHDIDDWRLAVGRGNVSLGRWLNGLFGVMR